MENGSKPIENEEILEHLLKLSKQMAKLINITTKMGKALHLIPVTEKEEREIQLLQRSNMAQTAKIAEEIAALSPNDNNGLPEMLTVFDKFENAELFKDVLGDDLLGGDL